MHAARHEVIASSLRSALPHDRRFDFQEVDRVEVLASRVAQLMAKLHRLLQLRPPQIDVAILEPQFLVRNVIARRLERGRFTFVVQDEFPGTNLDLARWNFRIDSVRRSQREDAVCLDDVFVAKCPGQLVSLGTVFRIEDNLKQAVAVTQVDENQPAVVAVAVDPAADADFLIRIFCRQSAAMVRAKHGSYPDRQCVCGRDASLKTKTPTESGRLSRSRNLRQRQPRGKAKAVS